MSRFQTLNLSAAQPRPRGPSVSHTQTVEFAPDPRRHSRITSTDRGGRPRGHSMTRRQTTLDRAIEEDHSQLHVSFFFSFLIIFRVYHKQTTVGHSPIYQYLTYTPEHNPEQGSGLWWVSDAPRDLVEAGPPFLPQSGAEAKENRYYSNDPYDNVTAWHGCSWSSSRSIHHI